MLSVTRTISAIVYTFISPKINNVNSPIICIIEPIITLPFASFVCPNAPKITIFPANKRIPYINVLQDDDSSDSEEEKEKPINKISEHKKDIDDSYEEDSFDSDFNAEQETKSESNNVKKDLKKFKEVDNEEIMD